MQIDPLTKIWFQKSILNWHQSHGRKTLPWQKNKTPYRVWLSEVMLQQTQVNTVIPYFQKFIRVFPNVKALALGHLDQVLHLWSGLGYYSRARNLHRTAQLIAQQWRGRFPRSVEALENLPGIGRSTAGAIAAISMGIRAPILDGNVKRVLARYHALPGWPGKTSVSQTLWQLAEAYTPNQYLEEYTQAMMDLGALICTRTNPQCQLCPLQTRCQAALQGCPTDYPYPKSKVVRPVRQAYMLLLIRERQVLVQQQPSPGIWGGLYTFPTLPMVEKSVSVVMCGSPLEAQKIGKPTISAAESLNLASTLNQKFSINSHVLWPAFRHSFTHFHFDIVPVLAEVMNSQLHLDPTEGQRLWYSLDKPPAIGLATPAQRLIKQLETVLRGKQVPIS